MSRCKLDPTAPSTEHLLTLSAAYRTALPAQDATALNMPAFSSPAGGGVLLPSPPLPAMLVAGSTMGDASDCTANAM